MTTADLMQTAIRKHQDGDLDSASRLYQQVLAKTPNNADAWHLAGVLSHQVGQSKNSLVFMQRAIELNDQIPDYFANLATALIEQREHQTARKIAERCISLDPKNVIGLNNLGTSCMELADYPAAEKALRQATALAKNQADPWCNLCRLYFLTGNLDAALEAGKTAYGIAPRHLQSLNNLGSVYRSLGRFSEAESVYEQAKEILGTSNKGMTDYVSALLTNLSAVKVQLGKMSEAEELLTRVLEENPRSSMAWNAVGQLFQSTCRLHEAVEAFENAIAVDPTNHVAASNLLYGINIDPERDRSDQLARHRNHTAVLPRRESPVQFSNVLTQDRKLRLGYISGDFKKHAMQGFLEPILKNHDREKFEIYAYAEVTRPDNCTVAYSKLFNGWMNTPGLTAQQVGQQIIRDEIDILIDLAGHTAANRMDVLAYKSAPVQVSMIGYLNTTGLPEVDYVVTDAIRDPECEDQFYTESVYRIPSGGICWQPSGSYPDVAPPACEKNGYVTLGAMHRMNKINDLTLRVWAQILQRLPNARLLIFHNELEDNQELQGHTLQRIIDAGIESERVSLAFDPSGDYLPTYHEIDVLLECFPWATGTTALESLYMGVPIPTLRGDRPMCRATAGALNRIRLDELVASSFDEYVDIVANLAADKERLAEMRQTLRGRMLSTICDHSVYIRELEEAYRSMWLRYCDAA